MNVVPGSTRMLIQELGLLGKITVVSIASSLTAKQIVPHYVVYSSMTPTLTADNNTGRLLHCSTIILLFPPLIQEYLFFTEVHISKLKRLKNQRGYQPGVDQFSH